MNATETLDCILNFPIDIAILIVADQEMGKSSLTRKAAQLMGGQLIDFRLSQNDVVDLKGGMAVKNGRTIFFPPEGIPLDKSDTEHLKELFGVMDDIAIGNYGEKGILFLDEANRADRPVQQCAFQWIYDRCLNFRKLPPGWRIVAAINGDDDINIVNEMEMAFLSRFFVINPFKPTVDEWLALPQEDCIIHPSVREFIERNNNLLDATKEQLKEARGKCIKVQGRRSWEMFSKTLYKYEADYKAGTRPRHPLSKDHASNMSWLEQISMGFVGPMVAALYRQFVETDYQALSAEDILDHLDAAKIKHLKDLDDQGKSIELARYNKLIVDYAKEKVTTDKTWKLSPSQSKNLEKYVLLLPNEIVSNFWMTFTETVHEVADKWYVSSKAAAGKISDVLMKPKGV
jgi:hypothetical protein